MSNEITKKELPVLSIDDVQYLTNENLSDLLNESCRIEKLIKAIKTESKERLLSGAKIKDYTLDESSGRREVEDINELFKILSRYSITSHEFISACNVSLPKLELAYIKANKTLSSTTNAQLKIEFKALIEDLIKEKPPIKKLVNIYR